MLGPLREPAGAAAAMGGVGLVFGDLTLPSGERPLFCFIQFPQLWDFVSSCILSRDIPGFVGLSGFCDQNLGCDGVCMEGLDGMDSEDLYLFSFCLF